MFSRPIIATVIMILWVIALDGAILRTNNDDTNRLELPTSPTTNNSSNKTQKHKKEELSIACRFKGPSLKASVFVTIFVLIFLVGFFANFIALTVIIISKPLRTMPTNLFLAALTVSDIGAIVFIIPIRLDTYYHSGNFCFTMDVCRMFNIADSLFHVASMSHIFLIAVERFVAVNNPFFYQRFISIKTTFICIISTWTYALTWACLSLFDWEHPMNSSSFIMERPSKRLCLINNRPFYHVSYFTVYIVPLVIMGLLYLCILRIALKQARVIKSLSIVFKQDGDGGAKAINQQKEVRATKTLAIIYGSFLICWLPVTIISITSKYYPNEFRNFRLKQPVLFEFIFSTFVKVLPALNSTLNPFLYIVFNKKFQHELKKLYKVYGRPTPSPSSISRLFGVDGCSDTTNGPSSKMHRKTTFLEISQEQQHSEYKKEIYLKPSLVKYVKNKDTQKENHDCNQNDCGMVSIDQNNEHAKFENEEKMKTSGN